jgi:hypothetical protein
MEYSRKNLYLFKFKHSAELTNIMHDICLKKYYTVSKCFSLEAGSLQ